MTAYVGARAKFPTRFGRPLGPIRVHLVADTEAEMHGLAQDIGIGTDDYHEGHYHVEGQYRYERAIGLGAKPRFGMYWTRVLERIQKRQYTGRWAK